MARFIAFRNEGERRGLKVTNKRFNLSLGERTDITASKKFNVNDVVELCRMSKNRRTILRSRCMSNWRNASIKAESNGRGYMRVARKEVESDEYNSRRAAWHARIMELGGRHQTGGRYWYGGDPLPDGRVEQFDDDMQFPIRDLSSLSTAPSDSDFTYSFTDIDSVTAPLGIPWELSKDTPFASTITFTGLTWDLVARTVSLPPQKAQKYLSAIADWRSRSRHTLSEVQKLHGKLLHTCLVYPPGRAYLTRLEGMLGIYHKKPHMALSPADGLHADLEWWIAALSRPSLSRPIPGPIELIEIHAYSDASSTIGIGIVIGSRWRAWLLTPGWDRGDRDITWAEAVGFELLATVVLSTASPGSHFIIHGDNNGVVEGWWNCRSRNHEVNVIFRRIHALCEASQCTLHTRYVASASNPSDGPSRGVYPPRSRSVAVVQC